MRALFVKEEGTIAEDSRVAGVVMVRVIEVPLTDFSTAQPRLYVVMVNWEVVRMELGLTFPSQETE